MDLPHFVYPSHVDGLQGYFRFGDIMSNDRDSNVNAVGHLCLWWKCVFISIMNMPRDAACMVKSVLNFYRNYETIFESHYTISYSQ